MLRLTPFEYLRPRTLVEALEMMSHHEGEAVVMGGGTDVLVNIKHRLTDPKYVIGLRALDELRGIRVDDDGWLCLGSAENLTAIERSPLVRREHPALADAAGLVSTPQVRNIATLGGNLCLDVRCNYYNQSEHWRKAIGYCMKKDSHICRVAPGGDRCWAVASADTVPVLMALDAEAHVVGRDGERRLRVEELFQDDGLVPLTLRPGDVVTQVRVPPPRNVRAIYSKLRLRLSFDFPLVGTATAVALDSDGMVSRARIVLTAVASRPLRVIAAEQALEGQRLSPDTIRAAADYVYRAAKPMDNTEGSIPHRKRMARVHVERALYQLGGLEPSTFIRAPA